MTKIDLIRQIIVTVDTEEEGLWGNAFSVSGNTTENLRGLPRFQAVCEQHGVPPTYLVDAPVVENTKAMKLMQGWQEKERCEIGAHCHAWCNPPLNSRSPSVEETFLHNLPPDIQYEKLHWLTERIADVVQRRPTSYRSGRYGFDESTATILDDLGYLVDSSVLPLFEYRSEGGPDFRDFPRHPYRYFCAQDGRRLVEVPVTSGFVRVGYDRQRKLWGTLRKNPWRRFRVAGIADRLGIARRVKLTPEGTSIANQRRLIDSCVADGLSTLVLMLHSSSLLAGMSPYASDAEQLESFYDRFAGTIDYAVSEHGFRPVSLTQSASSQIGDDFNL